MLLFKLLNNFVVVSYSSPRKLTQGVDQMEQGREGFLEESSHDMKRWESLTGIWGEGSLPRDERRWGHILRNTDESRGTAAR